jgi:hypothetical protein
MYRPAISTAPYFTISTFCNISGHIMPTKSALYEFQGCVSMIKEEKGIAALVKSHQFPDTCLSPNP